jgi:hypothetical protein
MKAGALNRWAMLKIQMDQGFFKVVEKKAIDISDISTAVEILWKVFGGNLFLIWLGFILAFSVWYTRKRI